VPIYEFRCDGCGKRFEKLCPVGETGADLKCPECGKQAPARVMSAFKACGTGSGKGAGSGCGSCSSNNCGSCGH
jgi:putative FmdB family regulatory protein